MQIYNTGGLNSNKRFFLAVLIGLCSAVLLGLLYGVVISYIQIQMEVIYLFLGWSIGSLIQKYGHGIGKAYCILGAVCTVLAIMIGDLCAMYGMDGILYVIVHPAVWPNSLRLWMQMNFSTNISSLLGLLFRAAGIVFGYHYSSLY
ncbi:MAG: hypothetical protein LKF53_08250 [Solobacterium sp.]|jgi:hypothetical protein|nr:hypothetical protein [Solobacterium sp.]MCH4206368.1 hypothetical protein [Solobacterium sp.]MCH4227870.1 hypothetical protein [Solobacterium sp.]MCH4283238.1 hypothetical protein [Solobacterium sp.]